MKLAPLLSLWIVIPYLLLATGAAVWQMMRLRGQKRAVKVLWLRRALLLVLPGLIALGPSVLGGSSAPGLSNLDVIMAVDVTPSMGATDYAGAKQRLDGVKQDLLALAAKMPGARFELLTFDSNANIVLPFTVYATAFSEAVDGLAPQLTNYSQGSAIDEPLNLITQELANSKAAYPQHKRLLFYFGDGEQTVSAPVRSFAPIAPLIGGGAVLGYGTTNGAQMLAQTAPGLSAATSYIMTVDPATLKLVPAISKMDPTTLGAMATQLHVLYQDRDQGGSINSVYQASQAPVLINQSEHIARYLNLYWLLAVPFAGLAFWEWQALLMKLLELRQHPRGQNAK